MLTDLPTPRAVAGEEFSGPLGVQAERLPLSDELRAYCAHHGLDPTAFALGGGEDYVLLVCGDAALDEMGLTEIGEITAGGRELERDGVRSELEPIGWDHLR